MDELTSTHLVDQVAGDGWILRGRVRLGPVTYAINVFEVRTTHRGHALSGYQLHVRLLNHAIDPVVNVGHPLTLALHDGRTVTGFLSDDGAEMVRTGALT
jgi:hypothetical protein